MAFLGVSLFALFAALIIFLLPGAQQSLIVKAHEVYAPRMVPVLLAHEPRLSTLTYGNTAAYCASDLPGVSLEAGGISDDYVCSLIENNYVSNTEELQLRLARELVSGKIDEIMAIYGPELASMQSRLIPAALIFLVSLFLSFTFFYFGSRNLLELAFNISAAAAIFSFMALFLSSLALFLLPSQIISYAKASVSTPLYTDLITISEDLVSDSVAQLLLPPIVLFGLISLISGLAAAALFYYLAKMEKK